jgi:NAD(P)-dependent dehydrogenase (short-subunit alcohol dehydrogenase family)
MKILLVGALGTLGQAVAAELRKRHAVLSAGRNSGEARLDLTDPESIARALEAHGPFDAVVSAAGHVAFAPLLELTPAQWQSSLSDKLMGQVQLALLAVPHLSDGGSITLTTGILSEEPIRNGAAATLVNAGLEGFVRSAALELPRGIRINAVSPNVLVESMPVYAPYFPGFEAVPAARAALAFARSVEGADTGRTYRVH